MDLHGIIKITGLIFGISFVLVTFWMAWSWFDVARSLSDIFSQEEK